MHTVHVNGSYVTGIGGFLLSLVYAVLFTGIFGLLGPGMLFARRRRLLDGRLWTIAGILLAMLAIGASGCSSSPATNPNATVPGTYVYTVTATSGTLSHTETINLVVQ